MLLCDALCRDDDDATRSLVLAGDTHQVSHRCAPRPDGYCWEWTHVAWELISGNKHRDLECFPGRSLCTCDPPCLDNGLGTRFVWNGGNDKVSGYGWWRPAPGTDGKQRYHSRETC
jgi:hypothetical protein